MSHQNGSKKEELANLRSLLERQAEVGAALQNSEAMMAMERLRTVMGKSVIPRLGEIDSLVSGFQNSEVTRAMKRLKAAMGTSAFRRFGEFSPAVAALQASEVTRTTELLRSALGKSVLTKIGEHSPAVAWLQDSEMTKLRERLHTVIDPSAISKFMELSPAVASLQNSEVTKAMERLRAVMGTAVVPKLGDIGSMVAALQESEVTRMMDRMKSRGMMMPPGVSAEAVASIAVVLVKGTSELVGESDETVLGKASEIGAEIEGAGDFDKLSVAAKGVLIWVFNAVILPLLLNFLFWQYTENVAAAKARMKGLSCPQEVRSAIRSGAGSFDRGALSGCRVVVGNRLNLRRSPNIKAEVIAELPVGAFLEVLDKSHRAWLLVEVEVDGELMQGWVFRRYTATFK